MKTRIATIIAATIALSFSAQSAWSHGPGVDCSNAQEDLARLQHEKLNTAERMGKGVEAIFPISLVVHTAKGTEGKTVKMATGDYNKKIDERIAETKKTCGLK